VLLVLFVIARAYSGVIGGGVLFKKIRAQQLEHSTHTHTQVTLLRVRRRRRGVKEMGGTSSKPKPGFPVDTPELDGDLRLPSTRAEDDGEEEVFFSAQKVTEKDDEEEEEEEDKEEEMRTIPETSSETQKARETREPGSASVKGKKKKTVKEDRKGSSVSSPPRPTRKRGRSPTQEEEEEEMTPAKPKAAASAVKRSKMIEVAKFSTRKSEEKTKKKRKIQTPHLSTGSYLPASSKHRVENELKRIDAVQLATKLDFVSPNYPSTRRSEQFKRHALRSSRRGELPTSSPQTTMEWA